jgi:hypothetical protein
MLHKKQLVYIKGKNKFVYCIRIKCVFKTPAGVDVERASRLKIF